MIVKWNMHLIIAAHRYRAASVLLFNLAALAQLGDFRLERHDLRVRLPAPRWIRLASLPQRTALSQHSPPYNRISHVSTVSLPGNHMIQCDQLPRNHETCIASSEKPLKRNH